VAEFFEGVEPFLKNDGLGGDCASSCKFLFFEIVEEFFAFLLGLVGEEESAMPFKILHR
jgi:hypothetical protein